MSLLYRIVEATCTQVFEVTPIKKNISTGDTKSNESNACTTHDQSSNPEQDSAPSEKGISSNLLAELEKLG
jgi:hypothetical protein